MVKYFLEWKKELSLWGEGKYKRDAGWSQDYPPTYRVWRKKIWFVHSLNTSWFFNICETNVGSQGYKASLQSSNHLLIWGLYSFSIAIFKTLLQTQWLKVAKGQKADTDLLDWSGSFLEAGKNLFLWLFSCLEAACIPWLRSTFLYLESQQLYIPLTFWQSSHLSQTEEKKPGKLA